MPFDAGCQNLVHRALPPVKLREDLDFGEAGKAFRLDRFAEMARFNSGSTVIVLLPKGVAALATHLKSQSPVKLGERLATLG